MLFASGPARRVRKKLKIDKDLRDLLTAGHIKNPLGRAGADTFTIMKVMGHNSVRPLRGTYT
jgi:hypothetical protein